jgi:CHASE2 domain-containing sensor protein
MLANGLVTPIMLDIILGVSAVGGGFALVVVLHLGSLLVALAAWRRKSGAPLLTIGVAVALATWMIVEIRLIRYSNNPPIQPLYLAMSIAIGVVGVAWRRQTRVVADQIARR